MPLTTNDRACNYFACKKNNEYLPVVYNGTFGAHHFCVEYLCAFVFIDISTILLRLKIPSSTNTLHIIGCVYVSLYIKSAFVDFRRALPLSICERSTLMRMFDSFD